MFGQIGIWQILIVALVVLAMLLVATGPDDMAADDDRPSTH